MPFPQKKQPTQKQNQPKTHRTKQSDPYKLKQLENEHTAFKLRRDGASFDEISKHLGVSESVVVGLIRKRLTEIAAYNSETLVQLKAMSDARLHRLVLALMPKAQQGDVRSCMAILAIEERRAKMHGLDAPVRMELDATINAGRRDIDAELAEVIDISAARQNPQLVTGTEVSAGVEAEGEGQAVTPEGAVASMGAVNGSGIRQN